MAGPRRRWPTRSRGRALESLRVTSPHVPPLALLAEFTRAKVRSPLQFVAGKAAALAGPLPIRQGRTTRLGGEAMQARDVMSTDVATVEGQATLLDAVKVLINAGATALPVVDANGGSLIGVL